MFAILFTNLTYFAAFKFNTGDPCDPNKTVQHAFFGFPHWWKYVDKGEYDGLGHCVPKIVFPNGVWPIALAVVDMLLYIAGIVAVISIIIAGISYITAAGSSDQITSARKRIINSVVGLIIVVIASAVVSFIGSTIG
jgi:hypothetical protein